MEYGERIGNVLCDCRASWRMLFCNARVSRFGISLSVPSTHCHCSSINGHPRSLTNKGKYGFKALVHVAGLDDGETAQAMEIAEANHIPKKSLDAILRDLNIASLRVQWLPDCQIVLRRQARSLNCLPIKLRAS